MHCADSPPRFPSLKPAAKVTANVVCLLSLPVRNERGESRREGFSTNSPASS